MNWSSCRQTCESSHLSGGILTGIKTLGFRLLAHLTSNSLLNPFKSAYKKTPPKRHFSPCMTISQMLSFTNNILPLPPWSLCCLRCPWSLYLISPSLLLVWHFFSFSSVVHLIRVVLYISVAIPPHHSPSSPLTCDFPQCSVLGSILFNVYTTLSFLISAFTVSYLLYADNTQPFVSL